MLQCSNGRKAFTIIEMIVVISIIGLIAAMTIANYRSGQRIGDLITETQKIAGVFKRAQNMALTGYAPSGSARTDTGYGIYFIDATHYRLFIDVAGGTSRQWDAGDTTVQDFTIANGITIAWPTGPGSCQNLVFSPPLGAVYCDGAAVSSDKTFMITQTAETPNRYLYIHVNSVGEISASNAS